MTRLELREVPTRTITITDSRVPEAIDGYRLVDVATPAELAKHLMQVWDVSATTAAKIAGAVWLGGKFTMYSGVGTERFFSLECSEISTSVKNRKSAVPNLVNPKTLSEDGLTYAEREDKWAKQEAAHKKLMDAHKARMEARQ